MSHKTRSELPANWPLPRKGTKYFVGSSHSASDGIPLQIVLRDILKVGTTRREIRFMLLNKEISVNGKVRINKKFPVRVFDVVALEKTGKNYKLNISGKKVKFEEVSAKDSAKKTVKIIGKVLIGKDKYQMNLEDGSNFLPKEKFVTGDSAVINLKENKIEKIIQMKEGAKVLVVSGKHSGKEGKVKEIFADKNEYLIKFGDAEVTLPSRVLLATE
jgi:small subunit ribosomal protein S4e